MEQFLEPVKGALQGGMKVEQMHTTASIRELLVDTNCINPIDGISKVQTFKFVRYFNPDDPRHLQPIMYTRGSTSLRQYHLVEYEWSTHPIFLLKESNPIDFRNTPDCKFQTFNDIKDLNKISNGIKKFADHRKNEPNIDAIVESLQLMFLSLMEIFNQTKQPEPFNWILDADGHLQYEPGWFTDSSSGRRVSATLPLLANDEVDNEDEQSDFEGEDPERVPILKMCQHKLHRPCSPLPYDNQDFQAVAGRRKRTGVLVEAGDDGIKAGTYVLLWREGHTDKDVLTDPNAREFELAEVEYTFQWKEGIKIPDCHADEAVRGDRKFCLVYRLRSSIENPRNFDKIRYVNSIYKHNNQREKDVVSSSQIVLGFGKLNSNKTIPAIVLKEARKLALMPIGAHEHNAPSSM